MNWRQVMSGIDYRILSGGNDAQVSDIVYNSKLAGEGCIFTAVAGTTFDGHKFVGQAAAQGAIAAVVEHELESYPEGMTVLLVDSTLAAMPRMAVNYYDHPSDRMTMIGVTGTKGKTTTTTLLHRILMANQIKTGLIGTIENKIGEEVLPSGYTTPQAFDLQHLFTEMLEKDTKAAVMEVSSHALSLHRVDGIHFDYAVFTNLSLDHLDFHKTMEAYLEAKMMLFSRARVGLTNIDDPAGRKVYDARLCPMYSMAIDQEADFRAVNIAMTIQGVQFDLMVPGGRRIAISYPYPGRFNVYNTMSAAAIAVLMGIPDEIIQKELARKDRIVRGRFQTLLGPNDTAAIVDYSHAPDALENVLQTIREFRTGRIITVVGCGGDRDRSKRPVMGQIAGDLSDYVVVTSDNPRTEDPAFIISEIIPGVEKSGCAYVTIENRHDAIRKAIAEARPHDIVLVAGKGHEDYQIIGHEKIHFDDVEEVENAWKELEK